VGGSNLSDLFNVCHLLDAQVESDQVGTRIHKTKMSFIVSVELSKAGAPLGARPEGLTVRVQTVRCEHTEQITDVMVEIVIVSITGNTNAGYEISIQLQFENVRDFG
jgi:hypothetical protein